MITTHSFEKTAGIALLVVFCLSVAQSARSETVSFESLLGEMTSMETLADLPSPDFVCKQFSSYDQRSKNADIPTDEDWFANGDRGWFLREEGTGDDKVWVLMDVDGPGAIVRFWSANPFEKDAGVVRVYLDGAETPAIEMRLEDMLGGRAYPFVPTIAGERSKGWNSYLPIPYAKGCKVVTTHRDYYYQINYRAYAKGTDVKTFSMDQAEAAKPLVELTAQKLARPGSASKADGRVALTGATAATMAPGKSFEKELREGPAALVNLEFKLEEADDVETALRGCVLEIFFDGEKEASVCAPVGDFFGAAPGINVYQSLSCGVLDSGVMYANWVMPYQKTARLRLTNYTDAPVAVSGSVGVTPRPWTDRSMYFHAKWRQELEIRTRPRQDWNYLWVQGQGRFVGDSLHVVNPVKAWWGEGDEKIYVDGEDFPSHFGTGTEDYYGYAWCWNQPFVHAYHNQPRCDGPGNYGHTSVNRFHIIDSIPFDTQFQFDMEVWHWADTKVSMATTSYWYARPGARDNFARPFPEDFVIGPLAPLPEAKRVDGALEGEKMRQITITGGSAAPQAGFEETWSAGQQVWWTGAKPGAQLVLGFRAPSAGKYQVTAVCTKAVDYGICQIAVGDQVGGTVVDFYNDGVIASPPIALGTVDLKAGENPLTVTIQGANPKAVKQYMFGLDYILLDKVE